MRSCGRGAAFISRSWLTPAEVQAVLEELNGSSPLVAQLLYGSGLRLLEALRLRVKGINFTRHRRS